MELIRKRIQGRALYLILTDPDPKTGAARGMVVDVPAQTVERVRNAVPLLKSAAWQPLTKADPSLDELVRQVPALRRYRGIEIRLLSGVTAWVLWRRWTSADASAQAQLSALTQETVIPAFEPDGDYFLAEYAANALGAEVVDPPRSAVDLGGEAY